MTPTRLAAVLAGVAAAAALAPVAAAQPAAADAGGPKPFINGFCLAVVAGNSGVQALRDRLQTFGARPAPALALDGAKPVDADVNGQLFRFAETDAPDAIVDQRRGACALVYPLAEVPGPAMAEITAGKVPVGPDDALVGWRPVVQYQAGRPLPPKFYLQFGEPGGYGVCAEIKNDLRRRDQSPAAMVSLYGCRIGKDERLG